MYLESHECHLARCDVLAIVRNGDTRDVIVVSEKKFLLARLQILNDQVASQWIDHVHAIWMQFEPMRNPS